MSTIKVTNRTFGKKLHLITAGDTVHLKPGNYFEPVVLAGVTGTRERPVIIETEGEKDWACFTKQMSVETYTKAANRVAAQREAAGYYPSVGQIADEAMLIFRNCQYVIVRNIKFHQCWPGAVYMDQCQSILLDNLDFREGTIAIGASGADTRDIVVQNCCWKQDVSKNNDMWNSVPWVRIHGASDNQDKSGVNIDKDMRAWDGDFFRAWSIIGNVTLRNNTICDAFNGMHFFNKTDQLAPGVNPNNLKFNNGRRSSANVLIEGNTFIRIRDNCIEPEAHAWNWVIRHNSIVDCYRPFSFDLNRAGWFYIYGNTGAFINRPSGKIVDPEIDKKGYRRTMSLFKAKGAQQNEGEFYIFHNSWHYRKGKGLFPKGKLGNLVHFNNAVAYRGGKQHWTFGNKALNATRLPFDQTSEETAEVGRFTRRWEQFKIRFDGDMIFDKSFPGVYRMIGYPIGNGASGLDPMFKNVKKGTPISKYDFSLVTGSKAVGNSIAMELNTHRVNHSINIPKKFNIGAKQVAGFYEKFDIEFKFLPDVQWIGLYPNKRPRLNCCCDD